MPKYGIIGSTAMNHWFPETRKPKDLDVVLMSQDIISYIKEQETYGKHLRFKKLTDYYAVYEDVVNDNIVEIFFADKSDSLMTIVTNNETFVPPSLLYSIKKAHIHYPNLRFEKHIQDFLLLREWLMKSEYFRHISREKHLNEIEESLDRHPIFTQKHTEYTEQRLGPIKTPKLYNKKVNKFFEQSKNYVKSYYVHDDMHKAMAHLPNFQPAYELMQKDKSKAHCDKEMFKAMSLQEKQYCVLEEAYVIALERKILPQMYESEVKKVYTPEEAFKWALKRICTNLCSGWFRFFSTINYNEILKQYDPNYIQKFFRNIKIVEEKFGNMK